MEYNIKAVYASMEWLIKAMEDAGERAGAAGDRAAQRNLGEEAVSDMRKILN